MIEQAPKINKEKEFSPYDDEKLQNNPTGVAEMIEYLDQKIKIEQSLGHSTKELESEKANYEEKLAILMNEQDSYSDAA